MRVFDAPEPRAGRASTSRVVTARVIAYPRARTARDSDASSASSSSGEDVSDDDEEEEEEASDAVARAANLVSVVGAGDGKQCVVVGADGVPRGVWRALLFSEEDADEGREDAHEAFRALVREKHRPWVVVLARGGHFAVSAFDARVMDGDGDAPKAAATRHATARRYVVRAKAGGRQVHKDGGGKNIKSAGSSMRRANEAALEEDMRKTFREWRDVLESASLIFISVSKVDAKTIFNEKNPMLDRKDPRVRRVPFMTGRPTFNETRRVAGRLATVNLNVVEEEEPSRPSVDEDALSALVDTNFIIANKTMPAREIQEPEEPEIIVPEPALHAAARDGDADAVFALLVDSRADPTEVYKGKVAYTVSKDKETRDAFRRAMARIPDAWDWMQGARVPSALTPELEAKQAAKEAEYEAAKKEKEKERKKAQKKKKKSAAAALLAKAAEQTTTSTTTTANAEKKSAALLGQANKAVNDRREQMARAAEARLAAQDAARRSNVGALGGATFRDSTSIGGGSNST